MALKNSIIYFMLGNYFYHKEIGSYINETIPDKYTQSDLNQIISIHSTMILKKLLKQLKQVILFILIHLTGL